MPEDILRRYTSLPKLIDILENKKLTWSDPNHYWEDRNDRYFINEYRKSYGLKAVYAICFTASQETYLQWKAYSGDKSGVCIEFDKKLLLSYFNNRADIVLGDVDYKKRDELEMEIKDGKFGRDQLPFTKLNGFREENEFRIIFKCQGKPKNKYVEINLDCVKKMIFSPWLHPRESKSVIDSIREIKEVEHIELRRSTILDDKPWRRQSIFVARNLVKLKITNN